MKVAKQFIAWNARPRPESRTTTSNLETPKRFKGEKRTQKVCQRALCSSRPASGGEPLYQWAAL